MPRVLLAFTLFLAGILCLAQSSQAVNLHAGTGRALLAGGCPSSLSFPGIGCAPVGLNFTTNTGQNGSQRGTAASLITVSRASAGTASDTSGNWYQFGVNVPRITNQGLLVEEARTNSIRNNTMQGAVVGSPGTAPNDWLVTGTVNGLTRTIVGSGTESGLNYVDIQYSGTPTASATIQIEMEGNSQVAALYGQTWSASVFTYMTAGSTANLSSFEFALQGNNSGGGGVEETDTSLNSIAATGPLGSQRYTAQRTFSGSSIAFAVPNLKFSYTNGSPVNITLRIGWPQLENNSLINSTVASATINAGGTGGTGGTAVYSIGGGTASTTATLNVTVSGGAITTINSVANAGSYTVFPPSPAALTYVSGTGSGVTGASVNLTPTNLAADAFATSPILTTNAAVTRAADKVSFPFVNSGSPVSLYFSAVYETPAPSGALNQFSLSLNDGTINNEIGVLRMPFSGGFGMTNNVGGVTKGAPSASGAVAAGALAKVGLSMSVGSGTGIAVLNGGTPTTASPTALPATTQANIGGRANGSFSSSAYYQRVAVFGVGLSSAQLQSITSGSGP